MWRKVAEMERKVKEIFFMGDSNFRRMLQCTTGSVVFLSGNGKLSADLCVGGQTVEQLIRRIKSAKKDASIWNVEFCNKIIVVLIGTNDVLKRNRPRRFWHQFKHLTKVTSKIGGCQNILLFDSAMYRISPSCRI